MGFEAAVSEDAPGRYLVRVIGDLSFPSSDGLLTTVAELVADSGTASVVVDIGGVRFLDSSGVRSLLQARQATVDRGGSLRVTGARGVVAEVLRIMAVDELLGTYAGRGSSATEGD